MSDKIIEPFEDECCNIMYQFTHLFQTIPFERRQYEIDRWVKYWVEHYEEMIRKRLKV